MKTVLALLGLLNAQRSKKHLKPTAPDGQTFHGDHAYVFYQKPVNARKLPLVFLHGAGQFSKNCETTPDGREDFQIW